MKLFLSDKLGYDEDKTRLLSEFILFCAENLPIEDRFEVHVVCNRQPHGISTTAVYEVNNNCCKVYGKNRALVDIMRSIAHEMTHMMQDEMGLLVGHIQDAGGFHEDQANAKAGELIKLFAKSKKDRKAIYENKIMPFNKSINESIEAPQLRSGGDPFGSGGGTDNTILYSGDFLTFTDSGKVYIGDVSTGLSPKGFWEKFRKNLESHINKEYPEIGFRIGNLGVTRELSSAAVGGKGGAKIAGSKHGVGLAQDIYMHTEKYGEFKNFKKDNKPLAKDKKFVDAVISFMQKPEYSKLRWGGAFSSKKVNLSPGDMPKERGILELHHFEFLDKHVVEMLKPFDKDIKQLTNNQVSANDMNKSSKRAILYVSASKAKKQIAENKILSFQELIN